MQGFEQPLRRSQSNSGKLPARFRRKEISIAGANVRSRRNAGAASQHHLPAHEFAVVLSQRSSQWSKARIAKISARSPLPAVAKKLRGVSRCQLRFSRNRLQPAAFQKISLNRSQRSRRLPLSFGRQPQSLPARVSIRLKQAHMRHRTISNLLQPPLATQRSNTPFAVRLAPIERCLPALLPHRIPPSGEPKLRPPVSIIGHKLGKLRACNQTRG